jgi:hypothetical protein
VGEPVPGSVPRIRGTIGGVPVKVDSADDARGRTVTRIMATVPGRRTEVLLVQRGRQTLVSDLQCPTGDPGFDRDIEARGSPWHVAALLGHAQRALVVTHVLSEPPPGLRLRAHVADRQVIVQVVDGTPTPMQLAQLVRGVVATASGLTSRSSTPALLAANALGDPVSGVRLRCVEVLGGLARSPLGARRDAVLQRATGDPDPLVRLAAARALGSAGQPALGNLAGDTSMDPTIRVRALAVMEAPPDALLDLLPDLARRADAGVVLDLAAPLVERSDARGEAALVAALPRTSDDERVRAARLLGTHGSVGALGSLAAARRQTADRAVRGTLDEAITAIQQRLGAVDAGRLALAEIDAAGGELSAATAAGAGELSEAPTTGALGPAEEERSS